MPIRTIPNQGNNGKKSMLKNFGGTKPRGINQFISIVTNLKYIPMTMMTLPRKMAIIFLLMNGIARIMETPMQ
jgi:hypothetical protein